MTTRKKTSPTIESEVLTQSGRRCCICYALERDFKVKRGQIAHLDHNPTNSKFENLCFLCQLHHDEYDAMHRQSKGLALHEVKLYRSDLYKTVTLWKESRQAISNFPVGSQVPLLNYFEETSSVVKKTSLGLQLIERQAGFRVAYNDHLPSINLDIQFKDEFASSHLARVLHLTIGLLSGLTIQVKVCAYDNWSITGFLNVLRNNLDIWILRGLPIENDERDPIQQPRDSLLVYRTSDGENRWLISTHAISESTIQIHFSLSDEVMERLANYLDTIGFSKPFSE